MKNVGIALSLLLSSILMHPVTCATEFGREVAHGNFDMDEAFRELMDFMSDSMSMSMSMNYDNRLDSMEPSNTLEASTLDPTAIRSGSSSGDGNGETTVPTEAPIASSFVSGDGRSKDGTSGESEETAVPTEAPTVDEESMLPTLPPSPKPVINATNVEVLLPASCDALAFSTEVVARLTITTNANIVDFGVFVDTILSLLTEKIPSCLSLLEPNQRHSNVRKLEDALDVYFDGLSLEPDVSSENSLCCFEGILQMTLYSDANFDKEDVLAGIKEFIVGKMEDLFLNLGISDGTVEVDLELDDTIGSDQNGPSSVIEKTNDFKTKEKVMFSVVAICVVSSTLMVFAIQKVLGRKSWYPIGGGVIDDRSHGKFEHMRHDADCLDDEYSRSVTVAATEDPSKMSNV